MKKGELRREQILDAAEKLFFERGYDRTSIQDLLDALKLSKGGFYHYFDAKESVLREICERRWNRQFDRLRMELYGSRRSPMDKLNLLLRQANLFETESPSFAAMLLKLCYRDMDLAIREQRRRVLVERLTPYLTDVLTDGVAAKVLHARHPRESAKIILLLACDINDEVGIMLSDALDNPDRLLSILELLNVYRESVEQLAGAPYGTIVLFDVETVIGQWQRATEELMRLEEMRL